MSHAKVTALNDTNISNIISFVCTLYYKIIFYSIKLKISHIYFKSML